MPLVHFSVNRFRNLVDVEFEPSPRANLIIGDNGSGKTSLLEAIHLIGRGRGFKRNKQKGLIQRGSENLLVLGKVKPFGSTLPINVGVSRTREGEQVMRVAGNNVKQSSELAELLPVQTIDPDSFKLLDEGPQFRRHFIDWGVFHVEHAFFSAWQQFTRALKQRNRLLRHDRIAPQELAAWDKGFVALSETISDQRAAYVDLLRPVFEACLNELTSLSSQVSISFFPGWDQKKLSLVDQLSQSFERDRKLGHSQYGPQRADLRIRYDGSPASDLLSRGQKKLVVAALKLAQGRLFSTMSGRSCVYLVDDLAAELDEKHRLAVCQLLAGLNSQVFMTCVDQHGLPVEALDWGAPVTRFHVKHGQLNK